MSLGERRGDSADLPPPGFSENSRVTPRSRADCRCKRARRTAQAPRSRTLRTPARILQHHRTHEQLLPVYFANRACNLGIERGCRAAAASGRSRLLDRLALSPTAPTAYALHICPNFEKFAARFGQAVASQSERPLMTACAALMRTRTLCCCHFLRAAMCGRHTDKPTNQAWRRMVEAANIDGNRVDGPAIGNSRLWRGGAAQQQTSSRFKVE